MRTTCSTTRRSMGIVVTIRDITERKLAEDALRASERRLRESEARYRARRRRPDRARVPVPARHDADVREPRRSRSSSGATPSELLGSRLDRPVRTDRTRGRARARLQSFGPGNEVQMQEDWEARAGRHRALVPVDRPRVPRRRRARSSSSSRSGTTSPIAPGLGAHEPPGRDPGAGRARRAARRDAARRSPHGRGPLPALWRARSSLLDADATTLRIGACAEPAGALRRSARRAHGRAQLRLERTAAHRRSAVAGYVATSRRRSAVGRPPRGRATRTASAPRGRRRSSRATATRCSARSTCIAREPQLPDAEHRRSSPCSRTSRRSRSSARRSRSGSRTSRCTTR